MGNWISTIRHKHKTRTEAAAESAILRERIRELEMQSHSWEHERRQHLEQMRSTTDIENASTLIQSPGTGFILSPTSPSSSNPATILHEMEGQIEFLEGQRKLQKEMESKGMLSRQQSQRITKQWKDDSVQLMERVLAVEQNNRTLSEELATARASAAQQVSIMKASVDQEYSRSQATEQVFAKRLEVVTDELASTESALAVCLALLKADPRRNNAAHVKDAAKFMEPLRFYSRVRTRTDTNHAFMRTRRPDTPTVQYLVP